MYGRCLTRFRKLAFSRLGLGSSCHTRVFHCAGDFGRTHFLHTCFCFGLMHTCKSIPCFARVMAASRMGDLAHAPTRRVFGTVVTRYSGLSARLPTSCAGLKLSKVTPTRGNHIAYCTTLTLGTHTTLCTTDPLFGPRGGGSL